MNDYSIPNIPLEHPTMDYDFLRQEGIRHLQEMARAGLEWTDFNAHDPGITILEQLCYAITDLGYRIAQELPDLLATDRADPYESLYTPARIMTTHPVTLDDLRKLVLDVAGVKNVWIEKVDAPGLPLYYHEGRQVLSLQAESLAFETIHLKGLYRVLIETSDLANIDGTTVKQDVVRRLHANRPLCEDFEQIEILKKNKVILNARIVIGPVDDIEAVLSNIYEKISNYLSPRVPFATVYELRQMGLPVDRIFDGPRLAHGFIDSEALRRAQRRTFIYTSDLIHAIMEVDGVRAVRNIGMSMGNQKDAWSLKIPDDGVPTLDLDQSNFILEKNELAASVDIAKARSRYFDRLQLEASFRQGEPAERDLIPPPGRDRDISNYYSFQHQFPACFGIGEMGLPATASAERQGRSKQLKAYLMFFDQLLANYFAQLAHVKDLYTFNSSTGTYFTQSIADKALALDEICDKQPDELADSVQAIMDKLVGSQTSLDRKNRFLNHLLARFAEQFTEYSLFLFEAMPQDIEPAQKMIQDKQAFLKQYPAVSSARGTAFNYVQPWSRANVSGLEKRIRLKLGLMEDEGEIFYLVEHILLRPVIKDLEQLLPTLKDARSRDPYSLQLSFVFPSDWDARLPLPDSAGLSGPEKTRSKEALEAKNARFRRFVEQSVRDETPAHLTPYIHWLNKEAMTKFEQFYQSWVEKRRRYWIT